VVPFACNASGAGEDHADSANGGSGSSVAPRLSCSQSYSFTEQATSLKVVSTVQYALVDVNLTSSVAIVQCGQKRNGVATNGLQACPSGFTCSSSREVRPGSDCDWTQTAHTLGGTPLVSCGITYDEYDGSDHLFSATTYSYDSTSLATW
jgi:hypothetical protein